MLSDAQKKALLRSLIDKVVIHRTIPDRVQTRVVWRGGDFTTFEIPVPVGSFADLSNAAEMEKIIIDLSRKGQSDAEIADHLTALGYRSPMCTDAVLPSTVMNIRLKHRILLRPSQSHPFRVPGHLTVAQLAAKLEISRSWIYDRIYNGTIRVEKDASTKCYLFPDKIGALRKFRQLIVGKISDLGC